MEGVITNKTKYPKMNLYENSVIRNTNMHQRGSLVIFDVSYIGRLLHSDVFTESLQAFKTSSRNWPIKASLPKSVLLSSLLKVAWGMT